MTPPIVAAYSLLILSLGLCGLRVLFFTASYLATAPRRPWLSVATRTDQPVVTVQLPIYNEPWVAARVIDAACRLRWPRDRFQVQVLDDSRDGTTAIVDAAVGRWRARGIDIQVCRRGVRDGYKAGALAAGLGSARGEILAVFDADFVPPADFLERTVPYLSGDVAAVQARWGHLNPDATLVTRIQAMALDGYFVIEQTVRARLGLFVTFNGSAGVWRREAIEAAGGWQGDSLAEDTDLSFRAQLAGWRVLFLPEVVIPAELPMTLSAFRRQQRRWAIGTTQLVLKLGGPILRAPLPVVVRLHALLTLGGHFLHLLPIACLLASPLILHHPPTFPPALAVLAVLGLAPPAMYGIALAELHADWRRRLAYYPALALVALGLSLDGSLAVVRAISRRGGEFERTPKLGTTNGAGTTVPAMSPRLEPVVVGEALLAVYAMSILGLAAASGRWGWVPLLALFAAGFASTVYLSLPLNRLPAALARAHRLARPGLSRTRAWSAAGSAAAASLALATAEEPLRQDADPAPR